jgi:hypothetical protein
MVAHKKVEVEKTNQARIKELTFPDTYPNPWFSPPSSF